MTQQAFLALWNVYGMEMDYKYKHRDYVYIAEEQNKQSTSLKSSNKERT